MLKVFLFAIAVYFLTLLVPIMFHYYPDFYAWRVSLVYYAVSFLLTILTSYTINRVAGYKMYVFWGVGSILFAIAFIQYVDNYTGSWLPDDFLLWDIGIPQTIIYVQIFNIAILLFYHFRLKEINY